MFGYQTIEPGITVLLLFLEQSMFVYESNTGGQLIQMSSETLVMGTFYQIIQLLGYNPMAFLPSPD